MKASEFYRRAFEDAAFRQAKLDDLRHLKTVGAGLLWFCLVFGAAYSLYAGFREGKWDAGSGMFFAAALTACTYSACLNQIAALEAFESAPSRAPIAVAVGPASPGMSGEEK